AFLFDKFGWFYLLSATAFVAFSIFLIFYKYGKIKLGKSGDQSEYSYIIWLAQLFSAGMGIEFDLWGAAEAQSRLHQLQCRDTVTNVAAKTELQYSFFHW